MMRLGGLVLDVSPLRASRDFRFIFLARLISLLGIGLLVVAVPVQTYQLTRSTLHVGGVATTMGVALFVGSLWGGILADRFERKRTIQLARTVAGVGFLVLGLNSLLHSPMLWVIYLVAVADGVAGGVSGTALMALASTLVPREKLAAAGALVALTTDLGAIVSPAIAGVIIAAGGVAATYFVAAAATAATVTLINALRPSPAPGTTHEPPWVALRTGMRFTARHRVVRGVLLVGVLSMLASGPMVLLPAYIDLVLHSGPTTLGVLYGAPAIGAVIGALTSGWTGRVRRTGMALLASVALMPLGLVLLGVAGGVAGGTVGGVALAVLGLAGHGLGRSLADILRFAVLHQNTPDELRGRVSSLWQVQVVTGTAVGSIVAGLLGRVLAPDTALLVYGGVCLALTTVLVALLSSLWRVTEEENV